MKKKFQKAVNTGQCILCHLLIDDEFDILCKWVGKWCETVFQEMLLEAGGFCNDHYWKLERMCDPVGMAYLNRLLLREFLNKVQKRDTQDVEGWLEKYKERQYNLSVKNLCPVCDVLSGYEKEHITYLENFLKVKINSYQDSRGLCFPHFTKVYSLLQGKHIKKSLIDTMKTHINTFLNELDGFIKKKDIRWERTKDENKSYIRAFAKLVGRKGLKW